MMAQRSALLFFASLLLASPQARAWEIKEGISGATAMGKVEGHERLLRVVSTNAEAASVTATIRSETGEAQVELVESDAWLHGAASLSDLPKDGTALSLTLYDSKSGALMSFSGRVDAQGAASLYADKGSALDIEVLSAQLFPADKGYELSLDLVGADTYSVAYGELALSGGADSGAEVFWDGVGSVWEASIDPTSDSLLELSVQSQDADGKKLDTLKTELGGAWLDGGEGVNTLALDDDPLTRLAMTQHYSTDRFAGGHVRDRLLVVSEGWSSGGVLPTHAEVSFTDGETLTLPVNSYQRRIKGGSIVLEQSARLDFGSTMTITGGNLNFRPMGSGDLGAPLCNNGVCVTLVEEAKGGYGLSVTAYGESAGKLPDTLTLKAVIETKSDGKTEGQTFSQVLDLSFDTEISAVFAYELTFAADPVGLDLSGTVLLLGEADKKGHQDTLSKGKFDASVSRDADGELCLAGGGAGGSSSGGGIVSGVKSVSLTDREGSPDAPPAIQYANGSGTKAGSSQTSTRPQLL